MCSTDEHAFGFGCVEFQAIFLTCCMYALHRSLELVAVISDNNSVVGISDVIDFLSAYFETLRIFSQCFYEDLLYCNGERTHPCRTPLLIFILPPCRLPTFISALWFQWRLVIMRTSLLSICILLGIYRSLTCLALSKRIEEVDKAQMDILVHVSASLN